MTQQKQTGDYPEKFTVHWLKQRIEHDETMAQDAYRVLSQIREQQPALVLKLLSKHIASIALVKYWLEERELPCYSKGVQVDYSVPVPEKMDLDSLLSGRIISHMTGATSDRDTSLWIKRDELVGLMKREGMAIPECLSGPSTDIRPKMTLVESMATVPDDYRSDPDYKARYDRAYVLHGKIAEWERMDHQNDPIRAKLKEDELSRMRAELAKIDSAYTSGDKAETAAPAHERKPIPAQRAQEQAILAWLIANGHDPQRLREWKHNAPGAKAAVREAMLQNRQLFTPSSFKLAWERLSKAKEIKYDK